LDGNLCAVFVTYIQAMVLYNIDNQPFLLYENITKKQKVLIYLVDNEDFLKFLP